MRNLRAPVTVAPHDGTNVAGPKSGAQSSRFNWRREKIKHVSFQHLTEGTESENQHGKYSLRFIGEIFPDFYFEMKKKEMLNN